MNFSKKIFLASALSLSFLAQPGVVAAKSVSGITVEIPFSTKVKRAVGAEAISLTASRQYEKTGVFSSDPTDEELKKIKAQIESSAKKELLNKYLARIPASDIKQADRSKINAQVDSLVYDVSVSHQIDSGNKTINFEVSGKINTNLIDEIGGYKPSEDDMRKAEESARKAVLDKYIANQDESKIDQIEKMKSKVYDRIDEVVTSSRITNYKVNAERKVIAFSVKGKVNDKLFDKILYSDIEKVSRSEKRPFTYVIVARVQDETTRFSMDPNVERTSEAGSGSTNVKENKGADQYEDGAFSETSAKMEKSKSKTVQRSSGVTKNVTKFKDVTWKQYNSKSVDANIKKVLRDGGYNLKGFGRLLRKSGVDLELEKVEADLLTGKISPEVEDGLFDVMEGSGTELFAKGTMDVDSVQPDPATGGWKARVQVFIEVLGFTDDCEACGLAVIEDSYFGIGPSEEAAIDQAVGDAATEATKSIVAQLRSEQIQ